MQRLYKVGIKGDRQPGTRIGYDD